jgi:hypothetical protein
MAWAFKKIKDDLIDTFSHSFVMSSEPWPVPSSTKLKAI